MDLAKTFGRNVALHRRVQGLSQEELAHRSDLHRTYISAVERGKRNPTLEVVAKVAKGLKLDAYMLLVDNELKATSPAPPFKEG